MADLTLDELRARLHPTGDDGEWFARDELALMVDGIDAAIKQRERDSKDAARYRWLREQHNMPIRSWHVRTPSNDVPEIEGLDDAIDSAMAKESGNG